MRNISRLALVLVMAFVLVACNTPSAEQDSSTLNITVSIVPQQYFVEKVAGDRAVVTVMVDPGASPATYEPRAEQLVALANADAYMTIGVAYEDTWLDRITAANADMLVVDTTVGIQKRTMEEHSHDGEVVQVNAEGELLDPHIWLSPELVKVQAANIRDALVALDPAGQQAYEANYEVFIGEIETLQQQITDSLAGVENCKFIVFHPSWGYFADEFGLEMISIEVDGQEPSPQEMAAVIDEALAEDIRVIFAQPEFSTQSASAIAEQIDGEVVLINPLAYDWEENLASVAETMAGILQ